MVAICYVEAWEKLCISMSAARSFPLSLRQAFRMGNNDRSKVIARRRTRTTETKKQEQCVHEGWQLIWRQKEKTGWLYDLVHSVLQRESRKCKADTILHVDERTQANTSSILQFGKRNTRFLTTAIMHLLLVRMLHYTYTKCSFFNRKHHGQWIVKSSQVTYVTMVPRVGNETLRPLGVATGNALSVTRSEDTYEKTPPVGRRQPMTSLPAYHNISAAGRIHHQLLRLKLASEAWLKAQGTQCLVPHSGNHGYIRNLRRSPSWELELRPLGVATGNVIPTSPCWGECKPISQKRRALSQLYPA